MNRPGSAQQGDANKYYQSWLRSSEVSSAGITATSASCRRDPALLALAQLATLRLKVKTGTVSLVHGNNLVLLAEAGQDSPLSLLPGTPQEYSVWEDCATQERDHSLDEHVFGAVWQSGASGTQATSYNAFVASDVANDARLAKNASLYSAQRIGFFAGVPILTSQGNPIGVFAVSDPYPRLHAFTVVDVKLLQDAARIVSDHLERVRCTVDRSQSEGFVRGLTSFVEGLTAFKNDLNHPEDMALESQRPEVPSPDDTRATDPEDADTRGRSVSRTSRSEASVTVHSPTRSSSSQIKDPGATKPKHSRHTHGSSNQDLDKAVENVKQVFQRAAQAITESTGAEGCIFFDASPSLFAGASSAQPDRASSADPTTNSYESDSSSDEKTDVSAADEQDLLTTNNSSRTTRRLPSKSRKDRGQGPAVVLGASLAPDGFNAVRKPLLQKDLKRCLRHYPYGKCFMLAKGEVLVSDHSTSDETVTGGGTGKGSTMIPFSRQDSSRPFKGLPDNLLKQLPKARWLMFLPLFNYAQQQWYACGFVWSNEADFHSLDTQIPYLKAFGSCIMSEVISMEAMNTSIARTTFIASISHDLRSPLHGVLGNLEFLEDTLTSAYQVSLVGSIETCGKTLLDTIDHLLDYAKINNLNRATDKPGPRRSLPNISNTSQPHLSSPDSSSVVTFDLALLLEEVTEAAFAGQTFRKKNLRERDDIDYAANAIQSLAIDDSRSTEQSVHQGSAKFSGKVFFVLDIQRTASWLVSCKSPGAVRRIILNIIGNAIKYCNSGCIEAKLCEPSIQGDQGEVTISVKDTGIGMSQKFLEQHLFKAFSQEDSFAAGAGLGLSIARQLVDQMDGKISVRSEKGVGTHVDVSFPMHFEPSKHPDPDDILQKAIRITTGKKICLLNPDNEKPGDPHAQVSKLSASIANMSENWFNLDFAESATIDKESDANIFVYAEPPPIEYLLKHHSERRAAGKDGKEMALLIICTNAFEAAALRAAGVTHLVSLGRVIEVISQPVGVRKLAKVLLSSLQRVEASSPTEKATMPRQSLAATEANQGSVDTKWSSSPVVYDPISRKLRPSIDSLKWKSEQHQVRTNSQNIDEADLEFGQIKAGALPEPVPMLPRVIENGSGETRMPHVLAVDDNPINLRLLVTFMKKIKLPYTEAVNGLEAYNKFKEADIPYDYVLMDLQMPVMDGLESTRKIRDYEKQIDSQSPATIIAITGVGSENVKKECMESGMTQFLTKPVKFKTLQQLLERHNKV